MGLDYGKGIDPRTVAAPTGISRSGFPIAKCCLVRLSYPFHPPDRPRSLAAANNEDTLRSLFKNANIEIRDIQVLNEDGRLVGSPNIRSLVASPGWLEGCTDVIVDITAIPISVAFPLLGALITIFDDQTTNSERPFNLHCVVCENPSVDRYIVSDGGDVAEYIDPFRGVGGLAGQSDPVTIWAPVLGERRTTAMRKIYEMLRPAEVKPFLPFPSRNPRRGDELVSQYRSLLFDTWDVDTRSFIYADERDPFDIYRQICVLSDDYKRSLKPLGTANTVLSAHSSKLLSLGVLLAAFEHKLAIVHVEPTGYSWGGTESHQDVNELFEVWLTGEPYDTI